MSTPLFDAVSEMFANAELLRFLTIRIPWIDTREGDMYFYLTNPDGAEPEDDEMIIVGFYRTGEDEPYREFRLPPNWTEEEVVRHLDDLSDEISSAVREAD